MEVEVKTFFLTKNDFITILKLAHNSPLKKAWTSLQGEEYCVFDHSITCDMCGNYCTPIFFRENYPIKCCLPSYKTIYHWIQSGMQGMDNGQFKNLPINSNISMTSLYGFKLHGITELKRSIQFLFFSWNFNDRKKGLNMKMIKVPPQIMTSYW